MRIDSGPLVKQMDVLQGVKEYPNKITRRAKANKNRAASRPPRTYYGEFDPGSG